MGRPKKEESAKEQVMIEDQPEKDSPDLPKRTDPGWSDYVLSHLLEDEKFEGNPTVDGLWRVAELLLGEVIDFSPDPSQSPNEQNGYTATVVYRALFRKDGEIKSFAAIADAGPRNTTEEFARHASAMAETRAAGRMLRRALGLRKVVTAEEMMAPKLEAKDVDGNPKFITNTQFTMIDHLAKKFDINGKLYVDRYTDYYHKVKYPTVNEIPYTVAQEMVQHIQKYGQGKDKDSLKEIPADIKGYKPEFKESWEV